jgi:hypothetical protein
MQPIDTWVGEIAVRIGIIATKENSRANRRHIVNACQRVGVNPNRFNVSAWWVGSRGIEVVEPNTFMQDEG